MDWGVFGHPTQQRVEIMEYRPTAIMLRQAYNICGVLTSTWIVDDNTDGSPIGRPMVFNSIDAALAWIKEATA